MQLIGGAENENGDEMAVNKEVAAEKSATYGTTISVGGIHLPVKCIFKFEYDGKTFTKEATYNQ